MNALVEFVRAQVAEDARIALAVDDNSSPWTGEWVFNGYGVKTYNGWSLAWPRDNIDRFRPGFGKHVAHNDPARALRDVEAKRKIIAQYEEAWARRVPRSLLGNLLHASRSGQRVALGLALQALATAYDDRPGFEEKWRL